MLVLLRYFLWILLVLVGLALTSLNAEPVMLNYYKNTITLPLSLLLVLSFSLGSLLGLGLNFIRHLKLRNTNWRFRQRCEQLELEVKLLKKHLAQFKTTEVENEK